jgi:hypothetical protein
MNRLNPCNPLFASLERENPAWWNVLVNDKEIYIEIRKENYIDVYYNGGNIIRELNHNGKGYSGKINYKYLLPEKAEYIKYDFSDNKSQIKKSHINLIDLVSFNDETLRRIKANISKFYPANSEKGIQSRFIINAGQFIDSEFAYNYIDKIIRIDLVWVDLETKKIVPVELKTMGDNRLYTNEIYDQLKKYCDFMIQYKEDFLAYYKTLYSIKKRLKILPHELYKITSLDNYTVEIKPLLLFGDCEQKWIDINHHMIDDKIRSVASGTYYYGNTKSSCRLIQPKHKNRQIY